MRKPASLLITLIILIVPIAASAGFPEFGFCPLGGPPGWVNRITGNHDRPYYNYWRPPMYYPVQYNIRQIPPGVNPQPIQPTFSKGMRANSMGIK